MATTAKSLQVVGVVWSARLMEWLHVVNFIGIPPASCTGPAGGLQDGKAQLAPSLLIQRRVVSATPSQDYPAVPM